MNVHKVYQDVLKSVQILLVVISVHVEMDTIWEMTVIHAQVSKLELKVNFSDKF